MGNDEDITEYRVEKGARRSSEALNEVFSKLLETFDELGFRVLKLETNGWDFDLRIRQMRTDDED